MNLLQEFLRIMTRVHVIALNLLKDSPNISDPTKRHDKQLSLFDINGNLAFSVMLRTFPWCKCKSLFFAAIFARRVVAEREWKLPFNITNRDKLSTDEAEHREPDVKRSNTVTLLIKYFGTVGSISKVSVFQHSLIYILFKF